MFIRILKKDFQRKKTMNCIIFLFVVLASMFVASGINNVITVMNGTGYYLDKAGVGDYAVITMGDQAVGALDEMLATEPAIKDYRMETVIYGAQSNLSTPDGGDVQTKNAVLFQSFENSAIKFFTADNEELTSIPNGHAYVSGSFMSTNGFSPGDTIRVSLGDVTLDLILDGKVKDALLGSNAMGNTRLLLNDADIQTLLSDESIALHSEGQICYIDTDDPSSISAALADVSSVIFSGARSLIEMCYVMDLIIAFITLILSVCLILVSFVVLKFSITFTISEEFREIGVMKAIGIKNVKIRSLYIAKYLILAIGGALIGFAASIPFGTWLLASVSENMVLGNNIGYLANALGAVLVILVIILFAYLCTGKVKKFSPIDAVRSGQTGERYKKKSKFHIGNGHGSTSLFLACNDVFSSPKRFLTIMISFFLCTLFVLILVNTTNTMDSPNLITTFGVPSDLYITDTGDAMNYMVQGKAALEERLTEISRQLENEGMPNEVHVEVLYIYPLTFEGNDYMVTCQQGMRTTVDEYEYTEGYAPANRYEIAITPQISEMTGAKIGDTVTMRFGEETLDCVVSAYFQTLNQLGEVIRLHEDAPTTFASVSSLMQYQIDFTDDPSDHEIESRKERIKELFDNDEVMNQREYCVDCIGVVDTMKSVQYLLLGITLVVVLLVTILMERSFIADERSQIATLKAIGFTDHAVIRWQVYRFGFVALLSVVVAACVSIPVTNLCITPIFGMMGATNIRYRIDPLQLFILYPGIVFLVTVIIAWISALYTNKITSRDTANIE